MMPVFVSTVLLTPTGRAPVAMSRPQSYISSALDGRPLKSSQSAYARAASRRWPVLKPWVKRTFM